MKKPISGLRTAVYKVSDLSAAKAWYQDAFDTAPYFDEPFYVGFNIDGYELGLQSSHHNGPKGDHLIIYWGVDNVPNAYDRLLSLGATPHEAPANVGGEIVVASVRDPWDNVIGVIYNPGFQLP